MSEGCHSADQVVAKVLVNNDLEDLLHFSKIRGNWAEIVGEPLAKKTRPLKLEKGTLFVLTGDAAYRQHLSYYIQTLLDLIASEAICGPGVVRRIRFEVGEFTPMESPAPKAEPPPKRGLPPKDEAQETAESTAKKIQDPRIKKAFAKLMANKLRRKND